MDICLNDIFMGDGGVIHELYDGVGAKYCCAFVGGEGIQY